MDQTDPFAGHTLSDLLEVQAARIPDSPFCWWDDEPITYGQMLERAEASSLMLAGLGVQAADRVVMLLDNRPEFLDFMFGIARLGAVQVPLNPAYRAWHIAAFLDDVGAQVAITENAYLGELIAAVQNGAPIRTVIVVDGPPPKAADLRAIRVVGLDHKTQSESSATGTNVTLDGSDPYVIMATSGTTSASKGVVLCHEHEYRLASNFVETLGFTGDDVFYNYFPLFHNTAQGIITWSVLLMGASMVLRMKFSQSRFWDDVVAYGCTHFFVMGPIVEFLLNDERSTAIGRANPLKVGWGIGFSADQAKQFEDRFAVPLYTGYGLTEGSIVTFSPADDPRVDTAGRPHRDFIVEVVDDYDQVLGPGKVGEIVIRPRRPYTTFLEYEGRPEETAATWRNLWLHTGDLGQFDEDGYLHYVDRKKDAIRRRGENISSFEVEWVVQQHPSVEQCAVVAVPSQEGMHEHDIYVAVVAKEGEHLDWGDLTDHCSQKLPPFAVPRYFEQWDQLPLTPTAKVRKVEIRDRGVSESTWDRKLENRIGEKG